MFMSPSNIQSKSHAVPFMIWKKNTASLKTKCQYKNEKKEDWVTKVIETRGEKHIVREEKEQNGRQPNLSPLFRASTIFNSTDKVWESRLSVGSL